MSQYHAAILKASEESGRAWEKVVDALLPGAHLVLLGDTPDWETCCLRARKSGLSFRDALTLISDSGIVFCPLFRKDLSEATVLNQVLSTGTGAFNIAACRIATSESAGRWPSNATFQHKEGCKLLGLKRVQGTSIPKNLTLTAVRREGGAHAAAGGHQTPGRVQPVTGHSEADGKETVQNWQCEDGCPVQALDRQTGMLSVSTTHETNTTAPNRVFGARSKITSITCYGDEGGASRYYKQFTKQEDFIAYLTTLLLPKDGKLLTGFLE